MQEVLPLSKVFLTLPRQHGHIDQHVFGKDSVSRGGIVDKNVRYRADELAVLDDRRARHSLNDPA